jgi:prepilin-type processing-associated H-X9-DG protein
MSRMDRSGRLPVWSAPACRHAGQSSAALRGTGHIRARESFPSGSDMGDWFESWGPSIRHLNGANILFCDGHVEYGRVRKWVEHRDDVMRRWNRDHQPHPESWMKDLTKY